MSTTQHNADKIAVFADVQNIYYTTRQTYQRQFNYRRFWQQIEQQGTVVTALAYATERGDPSQQKFQSALRHIGFDVKLKPFIQRADGSTKGDWDVGITIDVIDAAPDVDTVILLSGDGDFGLLLSHIKNQYQVKTQVYGVLSLTADSLISACDQLFPIAEELLL
ncbi:MAG: nuclease [Gammaproteobacteria bacterium]|nr:MAG: nuclease [Gammaproteobacteria bacterium]